MKTYSAQSGYVYQYFFEGHRAFKTGLESGTEFVFTISADRKNWNSTSVRLEDGALAEWEQTHERRFSSSERYAIAKIALFQAFDERPKPELMKQEIRVRNADIEAIVETLGL
ncbi:MAG TPA: hypothetical protein VGS58_13900 [Candidatus Sulfopaludibacter sp.]|nr:hypothetical protein [Candidatus Sulfopaludibacter sp.]